MERSNEAWLTELRDGHPQQAPAIEALRTYLKRGVVTYLYSRSDLSHLAEQELGQMADDFTQDALLKVQSNLDNFKGKSKFTTWASKIAANHTISELRRAKWRDFSLDALTESGTSIQEVLEIPEMQGSNPDKENERRQIWSAIENVIENELTERQRQALVAVRVENIPIAEVARLLNTNANNIYKLIHDARLKLKRQLQHLDLDHEYILKLYG
jgi:RNA polymerase sigma-70 factor (ECF subfamily)